MKKIIIGQVWRLKNKKIEIVIIHIDPKSMIGITAIFRNEDYVILNLPENSLMDDYQLTDEVDWTYVRPGTRVVTCFRAEWKEDVFDGYVNSCDKDIEYKIHLKTNGWVPVDSCILFYESEKQPEQEKRNTNEEWKEELCDSFLRSVDEVEPKPSQPKTDWTKVELGTPMMVNGENRQYYYNGYMGNDSESQGSLLVCATITPLRGNVFWIKTSQCTLGELKQEPKKHKHKVWINMYNDHSGMWSVLYSERENADRSATDGRIACVETEITFTEGEGL